MSSSFETPVINYQDLLRSQLLSKINIDFLMETIVANFRLSPRAINKCLSIITKYLESYLERIDRPPQNKTELIEAIQYLNKKCFEDFADYLREKYPHGNIYRTPPQPAVPTVTTVVPHPTVPIATNPEQSVIIIDSEQKDNILRSYGYESSENKPNNTKENKPSDTNETNLFSDPMVLQIFQLLISQENEISTKIDTNVHPNLNLNLNPLPNQNSLVIDQILDTNQVTTLLNQYQNNSDKPSAANASNEILQTPSKSPVSEKQLDTEQMDLDNLTKDKIPLLNDRVKELLDLKNQYLEKGENDKIQAIDEEKTKIINAIIAYRQKIKDNIPQKQIITDSNNKYDDLNLKIDPLSEESDLKNISIKLNMERLITEILLISYDVPFNPRNITKFNNRFPIYFNNRLNNIIIPPGTYDIDLLISAIISQNSFLEFSIDDNKIITIKNTLNIPFDLMIEDNTVYQMLGFTGKSDEYKDETSYQASQPYDLESNKIVTLRMAGSAKDPISLDFDTDAHLDKPAILKRIARGFNQSTINLHLEDKFCQTYDFTKAFRLHIRIVYLEDESDQ